jgi:hypothetical protein
LARAFFGCEHPFDTGADNVSLFFPCGDFTDEVFGIVCSTVQALTAEHADLDLNHVEPTGMLGGVVARFGLTRQPDLVSDRNRQYESSSSHKVRQPASLIYY